jgi:uncharacterized OB-fold protein
MNDEMLDCLRGLLDEIDRCGVKVSPALEAKARAIVAARSCQRCGGAVAADYAYCPACERKNAKQEAGAE